jgi:hypothetical protein
MTLPYFAWIKICVFVSPCNLNDNSSWLCVDIPILVDVTLVLSRFVKKIRLCVGDIVCWKQ